jgi:hypothetical protein
MIKLIFFPLLTSGQSLHFTTSLTANSTIIDIVNQLVTEPNLNQSNLDRCLIRSPCIARQDADSVRQAI